MAKGYRKREKSAHPLRSSPHCIFERTREYERSTGLPSTCLRFSLPIHKIQCPQSPSAVIVTHPLTAVTAVTVYKRMVKQTEYSKDANSKQGEAFSVMEQSNVLLYKLDAQLFSSLKDWLVVLATCWSGNVLCS